MLMLRPRIPRLLVVTVLTTAQLLSAVPAGADQSTSSGSIAVEIPGTPEDIKFSVTINGQRYDNATIDNTFGGTLAVGWTASGEEPQWSVEPCPRGGAGGQVSIVGITPNAAAWVSYLTPTQQVVLTLEIPSADTVVVAAACHDDDDPPSASSADGEETADDRGRRPDCADEPGGCGPPECAGTPGACGTNDDDH